MAQCASEYVQMQHNAVTCCNDLLGYKMACKRDRKSPSKPPAARAGASLPPDVYKTSQSIANQKKPSTAWVLRDAAEKYVDEQWPLLPVSYTHLRAHETG